MTQDMKKDKILHKIGQLIVPLKRAMSPLEADFHSAYSGHFFNRSLLLLLLMILGVGSTWGQPFTVTTDPSAPHYYLIQSFVNTGYYMRPNDTKVNTLNILTEDMKWYFLKAGEPENGIQYYYICNKDGRYIYFSGKNYVGTNANQRIWIELHASVTSGSEDNYKFTIEKKNSKGWNSYNIIPKGTTNSSCLNKQGGNAGDNTNDAKKGDIQVYKGFDDQSSNWNFIDVNDFEWTLLPECFTVSTDEMKYYYKIKNKNFPAYYIIPGATDVKTSNSTDENDITNMIWYFKEASSGEYMTYYYIIHAATGNYLHYSGGVTESTFTSLDLAAHTGSESDETENRFRFIVARGANGDETITDNKGITFNIVPLLFENAFTNNPYKYYCLSSTDTAGSNLAIENKRSDNKAHWNFEPATFTGVWADPEITCDATGTVTITYEDGATVYYTTEDRVPTTDDSSYNPSIKPTVGDGITTIKARTIATGKDPSNVISKTIVFNPTITFTAESYTYDGTAQAPVSSVDVNTTNIASTEYTVSYKKGEDVVTECIDAGTYTIILTDVEGGNYIVYGTGSFTIGQKDLTISADSDEKEYDGTALTKNSYTNTVLADGDSFESVTVTGSQTVPGTSNNVPSNAVIKNGSDVNVTSNYNITYTNGTLTVSPKEVSLNWSNSPLVYNGNDQVPTATVSNLIEGDECTVTVTVEGEHTNVGNYTATATALSNTNYKLPASATTTFEITKRPVTVSGITANNKPYDGTKDAELVSTGATFGEGDIISGDNLTFTSATGEFTDKNVGIGKTVNIISWTLGGDDAGNYEGALSGTITADITPLEAILSWSSDLTYDGTPQVPTATVSNIIGEDDCIVTVTVEGEHTNAGNYTATAASFAGTDAGNYSIPTDNTSAFTISPKTVGLTWDETTYTYDGQSHAPVATSTEIVSGDEDEVDVSVTISAQEGSSLIEGNAINHGNYTATAALTGEKAGNYALPASPMQAFTIGKKNIGNGTSVPASDITYTLEKDGNDFVITVKHGENVLSAKESDGDTDYDYALNTAGTTSKYFVATVSGGNNYDGSFIVKYAHVTFITDDNEADYYATFVADGGDYSTNGHTLPEGVTAYIVESIEDDEVKTVQLDYMPTGVPVLLMSATNVDGFHVKEVDEGDVYTEAEIAEKRIADNMLKEVTDDPSKHFDVATIYLLYKNEFVLNKAGYLGKGKIYLDPTSSGALPARLKISRGGSAGIENIDYTIKSQSDAWYTLDGRRLSSKPTKKGIYLQSGKKIVVK